MLLKSIATLLMTVGAGALLLSLALTTGGEVHACTAGACTGNPPCAGGCTGYFCKRACGQRTSVKNGVPTPPYCSC